MVQKAKEKVARSATKKATSRTPKPKKKAAESGKTSRTTKSPSRPRKRAAAKTAPKKKAAAVKPSVAITREQRQAMVAEAAYFMAERRGFVGGDPEQDWREAEAEIDALLDR